MRGTPNTLDEAIERALTDDTSLSTLKDAIVKNVMEYLAQQFDPFVMGTKPGAELWERINTQEWRGNQNQIDGLMAQYIRGD
jgi:hypothetical protein